MKTNFICPDCKNIKSMEIKYLINNGFNCPICGDTTSIPNKFLRRFLLQAEKLNLIDFKDFEWNPFKKSNYRCDGYFIYNNKQYVIEMQGKQHKNGWKGKGEVSKDYIQRKDKEKREKLKDLGIILIEINCDRTDFNYIYNNFTNNEILKEIFDFSIFDWEHIKNSLDKNIKKEICEDFDKNLNITIQDLSEKYGISIHTIINYLKSGDYFGWCDFYDNKYRIREWKKKHKTHIGNHRFIIYKDDNLIDYFCTANSAKEFVKDSYNCNIDTTDMLKNQKCNKQGILLKRDDMLNQQQLQQLEQFQRQKQEAYKQKRKDELAKSRNINSITSINSTNFIN